jgi:hypothetical protein
VATTVNDGGNYVVGVISYSLALSVRPTNAVVVLVTKEAEPKAECM